MAAIDDVAAERRRQIEVEGYTFEQDRRRGPELALAGAAYAAMACADVARLPVDLDPVDVAIDLWPWVSPINPKSPREDLVRAAALIVAAIEQIDACPVHGQASE